MSKSKTTIKKTKLPQSFKGLLWGYQFKDLNTVDDKRIVIVNTLNNGNLKHWRYLASIYGKNQLGSLIRKIPRSEFRKQVVPLIKLLFNIKQFQYATRGAQIKAKRNI